MPHTDAHLRDFYVSIVRGQRTGLLAGPFATHTEALAWVDPARRLACDLDEWAWFDTFGTVSLMRKASNPYGKLNRHLGVLPRVPRVEQVA